MTEINDEIDNEYVIINKNFNDIIEELNLKDDEKLLCESIITNLEKDASVNIKNIKVVNLPFIGCIRINPVKRKLRDNYAAFRLARKHMSKEEYKNHVRDYVNELKDEQAEKDRFKLQMKRIRSNNKSKYDKYCMNIDRTYAEMFIHAIYLLKEVPFDIEFERLYQSLKD